MKNHYFIYLIFFSFYSFSKVLIWDFGGVLFMPNKFGVARSIGLNDFISYMILDMQSPKQFQKIIFDFLHKVSPMDPNKNYINAVTPDSIRLPLIMCHWQAGTISGPEIINIINKKIKSYEKNGYFKSSREKNLLKKTIIAMFDPKILADNVYPLNDGVNLLKACANARNYNGIKRNINIGFSNWDPLSFDMFYKKHFNIFKHFDHIEISGNMKLIKPDIRAYKYILNKYDLNPKDCILIDDQSINTNGAIKAGMEAIVLTNQNYNELRNKLKLMGAL